jgi:hypothetical protein
LRRAPGKALKGRIQTLLSVTALAALVLSISAAPSTVDPDPLTGDGAKAARGEVGYGEAERLYAQGSPAREAHSVGSRKSGASGAQAACYAISRRNPSRLASTPPAWGAVSVEQLRLIVVAQELDRQPVAGRRPGLREPRGDHPGALPGHSRVVGDVVSTAAWHDGEQDGEHDVPHNPNTSVLGSSPA